MSETHTTCRNCGAALSGEYCSRCGQREGRGDLSFGAIAGELMDELFSWDSRLWRTLVPLIFRPGFLTAEFMAGRRARYVPPFRLYLIISFVLFLVASLVSFEVVSVHAGGGAGQDPLSSLEAEGAVGVAPVVIDGDDGDERDGIGVDISIANEDSPRWLQDLESRMEQNAGKMAQDQSAFFERLLEYLPQMMFLMLPVFALLLKICYLFSPFHYLQHLVFSLHFHSFVYLIHLFGALVRNWLYEKGISEVLLLVVAIYLVLALMRSYGSGLPGAVGKGLVILLVDALLLGIAFGLISLVALAFM